MRPTGSHLILRVALALSAVSLATAQPTLRFHESGQFTIVHFTDLHYGEDSALDAQSDWSISQIIRAEQGDEEVTALPGGGVDLVTFGGDQVTLATWELNGYPADWYKDRWEAMSAPVKELKVPYGVILGNHDSDGNDITREEIIEMTIETDTLNLGITEMGPKNISGAGNYYTNILRSDSDDIGARLWFLDSGSIGCAGFDSYGCVERDQVEWLNEMAQTLEPVPSMAFIHIPSLEYMTAYNAALDAINGAADTIDAQVSGVKLEDVCCPPIDTGLHNAFLNLNVSLVMAGHDHLNNFAVTVDNITYMFGAKSGYGGYAPPDGLLGVARVIQLKQDQLPADAQTWFRWDSGMRAFSLGLDDMSTTDPQNQCCGVGFSWGNTPKRKGDGFRATHSGVSDPAKASDAESIFS